jgi:hypothetical protein
MACFDDDLASSLMRKNSCGIIDGYWRFKLFFPLLSHNIFGHFAFEAHMKEWFLQTILRY